MGKYEKHVYLETIRKRYRKAKCADKGKMLDEFCSACLMSRSNRSLRAFHQPALTVCSSRFVHVEQKNWTHGRQLFGYERFDNLKPVKLMNTLYASEWNQLQKHFCPTLELKGELRIGARSRKPRVFANTSLGVEVRSLN